MYMKRNETKRKPFRAFCPIPQCPLHYSPQCESAQCALHYASFTTRETCNALSHIPLTRLTDTMAYNAYYVNLRVLRVLSICSVCDCLVVLCKELFDMMRVGKRTGKWNRANGKKGGQNLRWQGGVNNQGTWRYG
jgi:hypothetical protein